jgi:hypothetical protein
LRCSVCGGVDHDSDDCAQALLSPPSLIRTDGSVGGTTSARCAHRRTLSLMLGGDRRTESGGEWQALPSPQLLSAEQLRQQLAGEAAALEPAAGSRQLTQAAQVSELAG